MNYELFCNEIMARILKIRKVQELNPELIFHHKGETADDNNPALRDFIISTNLKYYNTESNILSGDFIEMSIRDDNSLKECCKFIRLDISYLYDIFQEHGWDRVEGSVEENINYAKHIEKSAASIINDMHSYHKIKSKLIIRPINYTNNKALLENYVYQKFGDIALVLYAVVLDDEENNCLNTVKIPVCTFKEWNIDKENIILAAMLNTYAFAMPRLYTNILNIENTPDCESAFMSSESTLNSLDASSIPLVTTTRKTNGAIALFYPGVKEKIAEMFDDSFYVAFTSIHEAMIHKKGTIDPSSIRRHIRATNKTFGPDDTLSDNVYFFDKNDSSFKMVNV